MLKQGDKVTVNGRYKNIKYTCPDCGFEFSLLFDPDLESKEMLEEIRTCPCGSKMNEEVISVA